MANEAPPELAAVWVPIASLKPWDCNPRANDKAVADVAQSIKRFGFGSPILARKANGEVIAGHTRLKAAVQLGLDRVPVRFLDLDPADAHLLALADNRTGELADWDEDILGAVLAELRSRDVDLTDGTGFSDDEITRLIDATHGVDVTSEEPDQDSPKGQQYGVTIVCTSESQQHRVYDELRAQGYDCRPVKV